MKHYKALLHDILVEIRRTHNRYLSILCIVLLGVGFFAGIKSTCPDMKETAQQYFEDQNLMDMHLKSSMGFTEEDVDSLKAQEDIACVSPSYSVDAFVEPAEGDPMLVRAWSWENGAQEQEDTVNMPVLKEGRWPEKENECLVEHGMYSGESFQVGQTITLFLEEGDLSESLKTQTFTIVGVVESPMYINFERGSSSVGNGSIRSFLYLPEDAFAYEVYTDVFLTYKDTQGLPFYEDEYQDVMDEKTPVLEQLAEEQEQTRHDDIYNEAKSAIDASQAELDEGIAQYEENKALFEQQIADAQSQLQSAQKQIQDSESLLQSQQKQLESGKAQYSAALSQWQSQNQALSAGEAELAQGESQWQSLSSLVQNVRGLMNNYSAQSLPGDQPIPSEVQSVLDASAALDAFVPQSAFSFSQILREYLLAAPEGEEKAAFAVQLEGVLGGVEEELSAKSAQLESTRSSLEESRAQLNAGKVQLDSQAITLTSSEQKLNQGWSQLESAKAEYQQGVEELESQKTQGQQQLDEAAAEIEEGRARILEARHDLNDLGSPEWYLLDRSNNPGFSEFTDDAQRVDRIAAVFPVFFILVAALVCLTTMTRMVEEHRTQMGTLKALGYGKGAIIAKYLVYALSASFFGSIIGLLIGFKLFPTIIFNAYRIMYILPDCLTPYRWGYAILCTLAALACTGLTALAACYRALSESPAQLMRPKAPRSGKRVLLERFTPLWRRLSFLQKVTARNLFRYKKRILMTVVGISGCTALMVAGFGLQHAIASVVDMQYDEIFLYDAMAVFDDKITGDEQQEIAQQLDNCSLVEESMSVRQSTIDISRADVTKNLYLFVPEDPQALSDYVALRHRGDSEAIALPEEGAVLTEKMARLLDVEVGDTVTLSPDGSQSYSVQVVDITENYTLNLIYLSPTQYEALWGQPVSYNGFLVNMTPDATEDALSSQLLTNNNILMITYTASSGSQFRDIVDSLNYIVLVLIVCAGALAFVVLYNLANINIEERVREIATIKVLGFYDGVVSAYSYRENILSSLMGMVAGLFLGIPFLRFVIHTSEVDAVMFNPALDVPTFLFSALLTLLFTIIVNIAMHFRLKKVDMVQSLKSIE